MAHVKVKNMVKNVFASGDTISFHNIYTIATGNAYDNMLKALVNLDKNASKTATKADDPHFTIDVSNLSGYGLKVAQDLIDKGLDDNVTLVGLPTFFKDQLPAGHDFVF